MPLVEALVEESGRDVRVTYDRYHKRQRRELSHVLIALLIDRQGDVREIYASTFLYPRLVLNNIEIRLVEPAVEQGRAPAAKRSGGLPARAKDRLRVQRS